MFILILREQNMFGCKEEEFVWLGTDVEKKRGSALFVRGVFGADGDTESGREWLSNLERGVRTNGGLV